MNVGEEYQIWLDLDGVLANFDKYFVELTGYVPRRYEQIHGERSIWDVIKNTPNFFDNLELMPDAMELVDAVRYLNPWILTGAKSNTWAVEQKTRWVNRHFPDIPLIVTKSEDKFKHMHLNKHNVLVDDWERYVHLWENAGGTFILHHHASDSIQKLKDIGVL